MRTRNRLRTDLTYLVSAGILVSMIVAALTGLAAQVWDLNDFVPHVYAGYVLMGFAALHVALAWGKLYKYGRWRLGGRATHPTTTGRATARDTAGAGELPPAPAASRGRGISRRGAVGLAALATVGGVLAGRRLEARPEIAHGSDLGVVYHEWSKPGTPDIWGTIANWGNQPPVYKQYPGVPTVPLPDPTPARGLATEEAIDRRRSVRSYSGQPMTLDELSRVLRYTGGRNADLWGHHLRAAPSSGALYPVETYLLAHNVAELAPGVYHYAPERHGLHQLRRDDLRGAVVRHGVSQGFLGEANVVVVFTAIFQRMRWKYQQRSYRYALIEAGHLGQNLCLAATSIGLGTCAVGAFDDHEFNAMLGVDGTDEASVYILALGKV